jgi:2',5'-phosphodiesterase
MLPSSILAGFYVYPSKIEFDFADRHSTIFTWYRGKMPKSNKEDEIEWQEIAQNQFAYKTKIEDIDHRLKVMATPKSNNSEKVGLTVEAVSKNVVEAGPGICPFEIRHLFTENKLSGNAIRVVTYNVLADYYADSVDGRTKLFNYCPQYAIDIDYRKQLLLKEIVGYNADILCMQEVDFKVFELDLIPFLNEQTMSGVHEKKGTTPEGLATFYRTDRFELIENYGINLGEAAKTHPACSDLFQKLQYNEKLVTRFVDRSTTLQVVLLRSLEFPNKFFIVANVHLYFHPDADHVRLLQIGFSMLLVDDFVNKYKEKYSTDDISLLFCGDFNSVPECGIFKLMNEGQVPEDFIDWSSNKEEAVVNVNLSQAYAMKSACGTPKYTNFTLGFRECIDYIFYQSDKFSVTKSVDIPSDEDLNLHNAIPSVCFPSDHIALIAELEFHT